MAAIESSEFTGEVWCFVLNNGHLAQNAHSGRCVAERKETSKKKLEALLIHHSQCEINYHRCLVFIPGFRSGTGRWTFSLDILQSSKIVFTLLESAPYTSTIEINRIAEGGAFFHELYLQPSRLKIRLYHDVEMAEVVAWDRHRHWQPVYDYPNKSMYQPDEKMVLNRFLGELLYHCRKMGIVDEGVCESIRINKH